MEAPKAVAAKLPTFDQVLLSLSAVRRNKQKYQPNRKIYGCAPLEDEEFDQIKRKFEERQAEKKKIRLGIDFSKQIERGFVSDTVESDEDDSRLHFQIVCDKQPRRRR